MADDNSKIRKIEEIKGKVMEQIKKIFTDQFKTRKKNIKVIISSNTKILNDYSYFARSY